MAKKTETPSMIRQRWLEAVVAAIRPLFSAHGYTVPANVRVSVGFPKGTAGEGKLIAGQCWPSQASSDGHVEIFLSPLLKDGLQVILTTIHEAIHATVGCAAGHKGPFAKCALALGFTAPMTSTPAGPAMLEAAKRILTKVGPYPSGALSLADRKKQGTRLLKCTCEECGFTVRITRKWAEVGMPVCPVDDISFTCEAIDDEDSE